MLDERLAAKKTQLKELVLSSSNVVFFGGAGVSTESGIPDFRSASGLYSQGYGNYRPEEIISRTFFDANPALFFRFLREKMLWPDAQPNAAHHKLAELEKQGIVKAVITQNIDGLHQVAGSENVIELHGSTLRNYCMNCGSFYPVEFIAASTDVPRCTKCGGIVKPDVVLYEEPLDEKAIRTAVEAIRKAQVLIVAGTSLTVYPAAGFLDYFSGDTLVIINKSSTPRDHFANLLIEGSVGEVLDW